MKVKFHLPLMLKILLVIVLFFGVWKTISRYTGPSAATEKNIMNKQSLKPVFNNFTGVNVFEWDFLINPTNNETDKIYEPKLQLIKSFGSVRHYLDWEKLEPEKGQYTFNPTRNGGWNIDLVYQRCKQENIQVLSCIKTCPKWLLETYPEKERDSENIPMRYGADRSDPKSYLDQAKMAFQFTARYGRNKKINPSLITVSTKQRWNGDPVNEKKVALNLINYVECDNERDKWWKGKKAEQTPEEYAANMSAFYDGHKGKLGKNAGVKTADPTMKVVIGGLATAKPEYIEDMIAWCKKNRGYKKNGKVDLCFDVINYHYYANDAYNSQGGNASRGVAPELSKSGEIADEFIEMASQYADGMEVWVTETGFDVNPKSPQRAIKIGEKSQLLTQADWTIRTSLLYARKGISKVFFYQLYDNNYANPIQYSSSGLVIGEKRRPAADFILQARKIMGNYQYEKTISQDPIVDVYSNGKEKMFVLVIPDEKDRKQDFALDVGRKKMVNVFELKPGSEQALVKTINVKDGKVNVKVTETPIFIQ